MSQDSSSNTYTADGISVNLSNLQFSRRVQFLASDLPTTNATASTTLTQALSANHKYLVHWWLESDSSTGVLSNYQIHALAAAATLVWCSGSYTVNAGTAVKGATLPGAVTTNIFGSGFGSTIYMVELWAFITTGANATTAQLDYVATNTTDAIRAGSFVEAVQVA